MNDISFFFNPKSIAVIGASPVPGKVSYSVMQNLKEVDFPGKVYPVNPGYAVIDDMICYKSVSEISGDVDIAIICVPADIVLPAMKSVIRKKVKGAIVVSSGFKETGHDGALMEEQLSRIARDAGIRVIGPNCLGVFDNASRLDTFFILRERIKRPAPGGLAILSQSGSFAGTIIDILAAEGVGVSKVVNYGNRIDVGESDCLEYLADDDATTAIGVYMESVDNGRRFVEAARKCVAKKPVFAIKVGRHGAGMSAAKSHTGAIAGRYEIYSAAFKKAGIIEVNGYSEFLTACKTLTAQRPASGRRVLIITDGGGMGASIADACEDVGLEVPQLSQGLKDAIASSLPSFCAAGNPIDLTGSVTDDDYCRVLKEGMAEFDVAIVMVLWGPPRLSDELVGKLKEAAVALNKPVIICSPGGEYTRARNKMFEEAGLPIFSTPEEAARAAALTS